METMVSFILMKYLFGMMCEYILNDVFLFPVLQGGNEKLRIGEKLSAKETIQNRTAAANSR